MVIRNITMSSYVFALAFALLWNSTFGTMRCKGYRNIFLNANTEVQRTTDEMWSTYENICERSGFCKLDVKHASSVTHLSYIPLKDSVRYDGVKTACKSLGTDEHPTSLCHVTSEMTVSNEESGSKLVTDKYFIRREPVCFPHQCRAAQAAIAHPNPLGCDLGRTNCVVEDMEAECGDRPDGAGVGNCAMYAQKFAADQDLIDAYTALDTDVGVHCSDYKGDGDNDICTTISEPVGLTVTKQFRPFESDETYKSFMDACYNADGEVCYMSLTAKIKGEIVAFNFELAGDYNDYPMCFPRTCEGDGMLQMARAAIGRDIDTIINEQMQKSRRLNNVTQHDISHRFLQKKNGESYCPVSGVEQCDILIGDFYCTKNTGEETVHKKAGEFATTAKEMSSAFTRSTVLNVLVMLLVGYFIVR